MPTFVCDGHEIREIVEIVPTRECAADHVVSTRAPGAGMVRCFVDEDLCTAWREVPVIIEGDLPALADASLAYSAGFLLVLGPWLIAWAGRSIVRTIRGLTQ